MSRRRICFVTGTRAEFGLMATTLAAIHSHPALELQIVATGMHLDAAHGGALAGGAELRLGAWRVDRVVPWPAGDGTPSALAAATGAAVAGLAEAFGAFGCDVVLVVGDRAEAFAAAAAGHLAGKIVAHVHGGDRALGQVDDALRHAITKLAHVHFPATRLSAGRLRKLGEDRWRIHRAGSPGVDGIVAAATPFAALAERFPGLRRRRYALLLLHPTDADARVEFKRAEALLRSAARAGFDQRVVIYPNNDPGSAGIIRCWEGLARGPTSYVRRDVPRADFLGLLRSAAVLAGNSSSGIIEAASFGTPVIDVGPRQAGRECGGNVAHVNDFDSPRLVRALRAVWNSGRPRRARGVNVYGGQGAGRKIADLLAALRDDQQLHRKLIAY